ncbi:GOLPH3/VPS74 family protein [Serinicoccus kebangsaanensis]|uniref:GOLPH3/VPS74 family protein n=1 Tax=Serinicoccus kebangsaanensis TaxID=2602069 RepID=UPI00124DFC3D|nr:GPP34 family phosphoprotein [Serinicoccus kebangsaanensis]
MLIAEEFLLVTRADDGLDRVGHADLVVAGALLCELALTERVALEDGRLSVVDASSTGDDLLDEALVRFGEKAGKKPKDVLARIGRGLPQLALERLQRAEVMQEEQARALGVRWWSRWRVVDPARRDTLRGELLSVLTGQSRVDGRTGSLVSLLHATNAVGHALPKDQRLGIPLRDLRRDAKEIAQGRWASGAVAEAVQAAMAAGTAVAVAASAGAGDGGGGS